MEWHILLNTLKKLKIDITDDYVAEHGIMGHMNDNWKPLKLEDVIIDDVSGHESHETTPELKDKKLW